MQMVNLIKDLDFHFDSSVQPFYKQKQIRKAMNRICSPWQHGKRKFYA